MKPESNSYQSFLDSVQKSNCRPVESSDEFIQRFQPAGITLPSVCTSYMLDYSRRKYLYVQSNCFDLLGYSAEYFMETGLEGYLAGLHPTDYGIMNKEIFPQNLSFLKHLPPELYDRHIFSFNYRIRNSMGNYIRVVQRFSYVPSTISDEPAGVMGIIFDITHFKTDTSIVHTIEKVHENEEGYFNELVYKKVFPVYEGLHKPQLTKREVQIIKLMSRGYNSRRIASEIQISVNTVNNHRKNMLSKTSCTSSSELISFAGRLGLL